MHDNLLPKQILSQELTSRNKLHSTLWRNFEEQLKLTLRVTETDLTHWEVEVADKKV